MNDKQQEFFEELLASRNYLGAYHYLKELDSPGPERAAFVGILAQAIADDLASQARTNKEKIVFLRTVLSYVLKDFPGLASLYREQLRMAQGGGDPFAEVLRGVRNLGDVASGRKSLEEGFEDAAEDFKERVEQDLGKSLNTLGKEAQKSIKAGIESIGAFFSTLTSGEAQEDPKKDEEIDQVKIELEDADAPLKGNLKEAEKTGEDFPEDP